MKNHYVYQITYNTGKKYIGVRSCNCTIEADTYMGSAFHLPANVIGCKEILSVHLTRQQAMEEEIRLHQLYDVKNNPDFYNQCNATSTKFVVSENAHKRSAKTRTGRTKDTHDYILKQVQKRAKYKGANLTPAQKAQWSPERREQRLQKYRESLAKTLADPIRAKAITDAHVRGGKSMAGIPNSKKGHTGLKHPKAEAWWYKSPDGNITIVNDSIRNYCKTHIFPIAPASIMRYLRDSKVPTKILALGWNFGLLNGQDLTNLVE